MSSLKRSLGGRIATIALALAAALAAPLASSWAQTDNGQLEATEPIVVLSLGSINKLTQDVNYVSGVMGNPMAGNMFGMMANTFTQGIDRTQPIAVLVLLVNQAPQPIAMVPARDVKVVLKQLEAQTGPADELDDGTLVIAVGASTVFIRQLGNWAILAPQRDLLDLAPADPTTVFQGMGNDYDLSVRLSLQRVPEELRTLLISQIRQGFEQAMAQQQDENGESAREMAESQLDQLEMVLDQTDEISFGINIDQAAKLIAMEGSFTAVRGSELAAMYGDQQAVPSRFSSVIRDDAAMYYHAATSISPEAIEQTRSTLKTYLATAEKALADEDSLDSEQKADLSRMIDRISELAMQSIAEGKADIGAMLLADPNEARFVFGSFVSDGNEAASIVKELAEKVKDQPKAPRFQFDVGSYKGINLHRVVADVPADQDEARKMFGEVITLHVGTGDKVVYAAIGDDSEALLKEFIDSGMSDQGAAARPVGQMRLALLPILQYAQSIETNDTLSAMIDALSRSPDPGEVRVVSTAIDNGTQSRVTLGEGLLQAIGAAIRQSQMEAAGQAF